MTTPRLLECGGKPRYPTVLEGRGADPLGGRVAENDPQRGLGAEQARLVERSRREVVPATLDPVDPRVRQAFADVEARPARAELELLALCVAELPLDAQRRAALVATAAARALLAIHGGDR